MTRVFNFGAGPAVLPEAVLQQAAAEMLDWRGSGMSVMEMSHRGKEFMSIIAQAEADLRELMAVPANYKVLFMQGGAIGENAIIPLNLLGKNPKADYIDTGSWSGKSIKEASRYGDVHVAASSCRPEAKQGKYTTIPAVADWRVRKDAAYLHICGNETIDGVEYLQWPDMDALGLKGVPLFVDVSSHILSRPMDVSQFGLMYGGAQKNIGPAGLAVVIIREDLLEQAQAGCPSAFHYKTVAENGSMYNTPPTYSIYIAGLVFQWLKAQGGVAAMEAKNRAKAALLYDALDASGFYVNHVARECRSLMNVPFFLRDESLNDAFLEGAKARGFLQLKGHKSVGGMRASIYNAMSLEGVQALVGYLKEFEKSHG
ncbi:3-phosphoserine/phosphohydroxythreonine transaminase [Viridibacterium curvum]|uniref:Phosphoserine aminotransferase n=1 Tax=Viridibacterium curvum TaxID=1101404 RepID=A0ABP9QFZ4_9RHOO